MTWALAAAAATLTVGPTGAFRTVQDALEQAGTGDRLLVEPGVYEGPVWLVDRELTIEGAEGSEVTTLKLGPAVGGGPPVLSVEGGAVTLTGFTIDGRGSDAALQVFGGTLVGTDLEVRGASIQNLYAVAAQIELWDSSFDQLPETAARHLQVYDSTLTLERTTLARGPPVSAPG